MPEPDGVDTIRETLFGECIGARIVDITTGEHGSEDADKVYFHLDNGQTFFAAIGMTDAAKPNPAVLGFLDMSGDDEHEADGG
jgi:hypothetical protein